MKFIMEILLLNFIIINFIQAIIVIPLQKTEPIRNLTNTYDFINYFQPNNLYTILKIGQPQQDLEVIIKDEEMTFLINSMYCNSKTFYNKNISKTFKYITKSDENNYKFYGKTIASETFYIYNNFDLNILEKIENIQFIYEKEKKITISGNDIYNNCGVISLELFRYNIDNNNYNFIYQLKKLGYINDYSWTIKYIENDKNGYEGYLIIGDYPHIYDNKNYNKINLRAVLNNLSEKGWNLEFKNITTNGTPLVHYMTGIISFSTNYIIGTEEYKSKISFYFNEYIEKNICFDDNSNSHYFIYYCKSDKFNKTDIDKFPSLNFYHFQYNYSFSFNGKDLFLESNGYYYFLIIFDRYNYRAWSFGKLFLKKYQLIFNPDSKMISYYIDKNIEDKEIEIGEKDIYFINNRYIIIIILVIIGIISFIIGLIIGSIIYNKKKKKLANEMKDEYFYNNNESLKDSDNKDILTIDTINS